MPKKSGAIIEGHTFHFRMTAKMVDANAKYTHDGKFIVLKGGTISPEITPCCPVRIIKLREKYQDKIKDNKLTENIIFTSPSTAASFVAATSKNGHTCWCNSAGEKLRDLFPARTKKK